MRWAASAVWIGAALLGIPCASWGKAPLLPQPAVGASSSAPGRPPAGAIDGERFAAEAGHAWQGMSGESRWWWQVRFEPPRSLGGVLQVVGDHPFIRRNAPRDYVWQCSRDGKAWADIPSTRTRDEKRLFRLHRFPKAQRVHYLRLLIESATDEAPVLREVEFLVHPKDFVEFPAWILAVNTTEKPDLPGPGQEFITLARSCPGQAQLPAQQVWLGDFDPAFVEVEPRPLCAFLSGNFKDWCEIPREPWRGTQSILRRQRLPLWASCGGAQGLAIVAEAGVERPWDCPHCRDPLAPKTPIYGHIGHTAARPCGDYSGCVFERGPTRVRQIAADPVFAGMPEEFTIMESHCGQIEWPPRGWELIATAGAGGKTRTQCLRLKNRPVYAAQFHIEMDGTPDNSRRIMGNFLALAKQWSGWPSQGPIR
jgi:hypothetical protein